MAVITGRSSKAVRDRCQELGITLLAAGQGKKWPAWKRILTTAGVSAEAAAMIGDDLPDLPLIKAAGLGIAVANAVPEVKEMANLVTTRSGGDGAIREAIEMILKETGEWSSLVDSFTTDLGEVPQS